MIKLDMSERANWRQLAQEVGFTFADMYGEPYWDETSAYQFSLRQIEEDIDAPATELHDMCRQAVATIVENEYLLTRLAIPPEHWDLVLGSWRQGEPELYGRFDLAYDGKGPAKMLEYNADTPTSLYETAAFQWTWLEEHIAAGVLNVRDDQFNGVHEALVERFRDMFAPNTNLHFTAIAGNPEDYATVEALAWAAREAGLGAHYTDLDKIGISDAGQFTDDQDRVMGVLFKLYPWEDLLRDPFAAHLAGSGCRFVEPPWKAVVSNKGLLPVLWEMFEGHPNLLPAFFHDDVAAALSGGTPSAAVADSFGRAAPGLLKGHVIKPLFSREGASLSIVEQGAVTEASADAAYAAHPKIVQAYHPLPMFDGFRPVIGAWIVGQTCCGMAVREDRSRITQNLSRFKPHFIHD